MNKLQIMFHIVLVSYYMAIIGETYCAGTQSPQSYLRYYLYVYIMKVQHSLGQPNDDNVG